MISLIDFIKLESNKSKANLLFAGDAMNNHNQRIKAHVNGYYDYSNCFDNIVSYVKSKDYSVINLETPIYYQKYLPSEKAKLLFWAPENYLQELSNVGFNLFLTANNHCVDQGKDGLIGTISALDKNYLDHIGTYKSKADRKNSIPFIKDINGIKIGFLNYTYKTDNEKPEGFDFNDIVIDFIDKEKIKNDIKLTKNNGAEFIICCIHWGIERESMPSEKQKDLAKTILNYGVDAIIGSHPHVIQPIEFVNGKLIVYSLGNFIACMNKNYRGAQDTDGGLLLNLELIKDNNGKVNINKVNYNIIFTYTDSLTNNLKVDLVDKVNSDYAKFFAKEIRKFLKEYNINVKEEGCE